MTRLTKPISEIRKVCVQMPERRITLSSLECCAQYHNLGNGCTRTRLTQIWVNHRVVLARMAGITEFTCTCVLYSITAVSYTHLTLPTIVAV